MVKKKSQNKKKSKTIPQKESMIKKLDKIMFICNTDK